MKVSRPELALFNLVYSRKFNVVGQGPAMGDLSSKAYRKTEAKSASRVGDCMYNYTD